MMQVTVGRLEQPVVRNGRLFTHQGAIVRSLHPGRPGWYFECRMWANATVMSSTFWLMTPPGSARRLELDIQECVGRTTDQTAPWARQWDRIFHSNLIDWHRQRKVQFQNSVPTPTRNWERFYIYAASWKNPREVLFFLDGRHVYTIRPDTDWDLPTHLQRSVTIYDWNPIPPDGSLVESGTPEQRTTSHGWIRVWRLESTDTNAAARPGPERR